MGFPAARLSPFYREGRGPQTEYSRSPGCAGTRRAPRLSPAASRRSLTPPPPTPTPGPTLVSRLGKSRRRQGPKRAPAGAGADRPAGGAPGPPCSFLGSWQGRGRGWGLSGPRWLREAGSRTAGTAARAGLGVSPPSRLRPGRAAGPATSRRLRARSPESQGRPLKARPLGPTLQTLRPTLQTRKLRPPSYKRQIRSRP